MQFFLFIRQFFPHSHWQSQWMHEWIAEWAELWAQCVQCELWHCTPPILTIFTLISDTNRRRTLIALFGTDCILLETYMDAVSNSIWISPACDAISIRHRIWPVFHCRRAGNMHDDCLARPALIWKWYKKENQYQGGREWDSWEYQQVAGC